MNDENRPPASPGAGERAAAGPDEARTGTQVIAVIPARGGSKGIVGKNLREVGGRSLVARAVSSCLAARSIGRTVVTTDDDAIAAEAVRCGAEVVRRPSSLATDTASSESAVLHVLDQLGPSSGRVVTFVQCTSPFIDPASIDRAVARVASGGADVVFAAAESHDFVWRRSRGGVVGANHDERRPRARRQDRDQEYRETGAFYVMDRRGFEAARHRFFGRIDVELVHADGALEIDVPEDLARARRVGERGVEPGLDRSATTDEPIGPVDVLVTDFDGVHTDNTVWVNEHGEEAVRASRADGLGIAELRRRGIAVLVLSTEVNPVVRQRAAKLGVECISGCDDKLGALRAWLDERGLGRERTAYVGNDRNDAECLAWVGWPIVVADSHPSVLALGRVVLRRRGGDGAVREVADRIAAGMERETDRVPRSSIGTEVLHG